MVAPGAARLVNEEIQALPPLAASRIRFPNTVVSRLRVLLLAVDADDGGLAVALRLVRREHGNCERADRTTDPGAGVGERLEVALEAAGERIVDDRGDRDLAQRRLDALPGLFRDFLDEGQRALDVHR